MDQPSSGTRRFAIFAYGLICYLMFLGVFLYAIAFLCNLGVPNSIDSASRSPIAIAVIVNCLLLVAFAVQHSGMARPTFKRWWTTIIPEESERSTYVLASNIVMILLFWLWQPMGGVVWDIQNTVARALMYGLFAAGWALVLYSTCLLNHFDLFGMRQVWLCYRGEPYSTLEFRAPSLYQYVRHPLYVGWLTVFWAAPTMTVSHLLFAVVTSVYILVAIQLEERNLTELLPGYAAYREKVPMLIPSLRKRN